MGDECCRHLVGGSAERDYHHLLPTTHQCTCIFIHVLYVRVASNAYTCMNMCTVCTVWLAHLPEVNTNGALELLKADVNQQLDGVGIVEFEGVGLVGVLLSLHQVVLQLQGETEREGDEGERPLPRFQCWTHNLTEFSELSPSLVVQTKLKSCTEKNPLYTPHSTHTHTHGELLPSLATSAYTLSMVLLFLSSSSMLR